MLPRKMVVTIGRERSSVNGGADAQKIDASDCRAASRHKAPGRNESDSHVPFPTVTRAPKPRLLEAVVAAEAARGAKKRIPRLSLGMTFKG